MNLKRVTWAGPVHKAGEVEQSQPPCTKAKPKDSPSPNSRSKDAKGDISRCGYVLDNLDFVSPEIISVWNFSLQSESCEVRGAGFPM